MSLYTSAYTGAEIDAALPLALGVGNRNLLHNWDFRNPVNQKAASSYTGAVRGLDRWRSNAANLTLVINSDCVTLSPASAASDLEQNVDNPSLLYGKTVTFTVESEHGTHSTTINIPASAPASNTSYGSVATPFGSIYLRFVSSGEIRPRISVTAETDFYAAKLEAGSISTLENDPPADYGEQLALCKRYYRIWTTSAARTAALTELYLMRLASPSTGTIDIGGTTYYYASAEL